MQNEEKTVEVKKRLSQEEAGKIALKLVAQKSEKRGLNCDVEQFNAKIEMLSERMHVTQANLRRFFACFVLRAALDGYGLSNYVQVMPRQDVADQENWGIAISLLRNEGVFISRREFIGQLDSLERKTAIPKRDLQLFYLQEIIPYVVGNAFGWVSCTITFPDNGNEPDDITGSFGG